MLELLSILTPLAIIDSLSVIPVAMVPLILLLTGRHAVAGSLAFIAGIVLTYLPFGLLLLFGLDTLFDSLTQNLIAWWRKEPDFGELVLEVIIGVIILLAGIRLSRNRGRKAVQQVEAGLSPLQAFTVAVMLNLSGIWGALPYFAAITRILKQDLSDTGMITALLYYNLVFVLPLCVFLLIRLFAGKRAMRWLENINSFIIHWGGKVLIILLIGLGVILIVDGVSWLLGNPWFDFIQAQDTGGTHATSGIVRADTAY